MDENPENAVEVKRKAKPLLGVVFGPKELNTEFIVEGVPYVVREGVITPPITTELVPTNMWGLGLVVEKG